MRITCGACNAQYNLPDDRVRGRRVKVRCKRCSEGIIVDGTQLVAADEFEEEATRVMDSPLGNNEGQRMWTVNLSDEEQGDMTDEELIAGWQAGVVTEDAYVWREGMDDWEALLDVPEIVAMLSEVAPPAHREASQPHASAPVQGGYQEPASPQSAAHAPAPEPPAPEPPAPEPPAPLPPPQSAPPPPRSVPPAAGRSFPAPPPRPSQSPPQPTYAAAPSPPQPPAQPANLFDPRPPTRERPKHAASRDENSVLFSLDALKAAAAPAPASPSGAPKPPVSAGRVSEDILTMGGPTIGDLNAAPLIQIEQPPAPPPVAAGAVPLAVSSAPPMPMHSAPPEKRSPVVLIAAVLVGALLAGGGVFAALKFTGEDKAKAEAKTEEPSTPRTADTSDEPAASASASVSAASATASASASATATAEPSADAPEAPAQTPPSSGTPKANTGSSKSGSSSGSSSTGSSKSGSSSSGSSSDSKKDDKKEEKKDDSSSSSESSAGAINMGAVKSALSAAASSAQSCGSTDGPKGKGKVQVTFVPSGRVTSANVVSGPFGGTTVGGCVARIFRRAKVPKFTGAPVTVAKSFKIK